MIHIADGSRYCLGVPRWRKMEQERVLCPQWWCGWCKLYHHKECALQTLSQLVSGKWTVKQRLIGLVASSNRRLRVHWRFENSESTWCEWHRMTQRRKSPFHCFFLALPQACSILVLQPGIEPEPPTLEAQSLNHWTAREFPKVTISEPPSLLPAPSYWFTPSRELKILNLWDKLQYSNYLILRDRWF